MAFELHIESRALSDITTRAPAGSGHILRSDRRGTDGRQLGACQRRPRHVDLSGEPLPDDGCSRVECSCVPHE